MSSRVVAAIVPVWNRPRLVLEALETIAAQTRPPDRLVIVDDGSTDETPERLEAWGAAHRTSLPIEIRHEANRGAAAARNLGAAVANGVEFLAFLDSDDLWPPNYLERMIAILSKDASLVAATCDRLDRAGPDRRKLRRFDNLPKATTRRLFVNGSPGTPNTVFRAAPFRRLGGYDEAMVTLEDFDLMLRLSCLGAWGYAPGAPVTVRRDFGDPAEARHLSRKDPEWRRRQAETLERFLFERGGEEIVPVRFWKPRLADVWYKAGRRLEKSGRPEEAMACFSRSLELQPAHLKARFQRARLARSRSPESGKRP